MSLTLSVAKEIEFDRLVHQVFQAKERLAGATRLREGVTADSVKFPVMAAGLARQRTAPQVKLEIMNVVHTQISCSLDNWNASDMTDMFDQAEVSWSEQAELASVIANALGRRRDQVVIDALVAAGVQTVAATGFGGENTLNIERINEAHRLLDLVEAPSEDRHFICHATSLSQFLGTTEGGSNDYNNLRLLQQGGLQDGAQAFGFHWHKTGNRTEGGLPIAAGTGVRKNYVFHKNAVGVAKGTLAKRTDITWLADYASWLVSGFERLGACVIDATGCVEVLCDEVA